MTESREQFKARLGIGRPSRAFRLLGGAGTARTTALDRDDGPGVAGSSTEHWDGRRDAVATHLTITTTDIGRAALENHRSAIKETSS